MYFLTHFVKIMNKKNLYFIIWLNLIVVISTCFSCGDITPDVDFSKKHENAQYAFEEKNGLMQYVKYKGKELDPNSVEGLLAVQAIKNNKYDDTSIVPDKKVSQENRSLEGLEKYREMSKNAHQLFLKEEGKLKYAKKDGYEYDLTNPTDKLRAIRECNTSSSFEYEEEGQLLFARLDGEDFDTTSPEVRTKYLEKKKESETLQQGDLDIEIKAFEISDLSDSFYVDICVKNLTNSPKSIKNINIQCEKCKFAKQYGTLIEFTPFDINITNANLGKNKTMDLTIQTTTDSSTIKGIKKLPSLPVTLEISIKDNSTNIVIVDKKGVSIPFKLTSRID